MNKISNLAHFLNSMKETLPFKDQKDFEKKSKRIRSLE